MQLYSITFVITSVCMYEYMHIGSSNIFN